MFNRVFSTTLDVELSTKTPINSFQVNFLFQYPFGIAKPHTFSGGLERKSFAWNGSITMLQANLLSFKILITCAVLQQSY